MGSMLKFFGMGKKKPPTAQESIQNLRETEDMLGKKQEFLERKVKEEVATARKHASTNKRLALQALRRKKKYEKQLQQIDGTLSTIEFQREALENATTNTQILKAMGEAAKTLKASHNNMDVDKVHDLMDDIAEQQQVAGEIAEAISNPIGFPGQDVDDDDLLAELEEMEQQDLNQQLLDVGAAPLPKLPDVPEAEPAKTKQQQQDDQQLNQLKAWANAE